jgi:hypothetical protein
MEGRERQTRFGSRFSIEGRIGWSGTENTFHSLAGNTSQRGATAYGQTSIPITRTRF